MIGSVRAARQPDGNNRLRSPHVRAEILTIGDELCRGEIVNTNASYLAARLWDLDITTRWMTSCLDDDADIAAAPRARGDARGHRRHLRRPRADRGRSDGRGRRAARRRRVDRRRARARCHGGAVCGANRRHRDAAAAGARARRRARARKSRRPRAVLRGDRRRRAGDLPCPACRARSSAIFDAKLGARLAELREARGDVERVARTIYRVFGRGESQISHACRGVVDPSAPPFGGARPPGASPDRRFTRAAIRRRCRSGASPDRRFTRAAIRRRCRSGASPNRQYYPAPPFGGAECRSGKPRIVDGVAGATIHYQVKFPETLVKLVVRDRDQAAADARLAAMDAPLRERFAGCSTAPATRRSSTRSGGACRSARARSRPRSRAPAACSASVDALARQLARVSRRRDRVLERREDPPAGRRSGDARRARRGQRAGRARDGERRAAALRRRLRAGDQRHRRAPTAARRTSRSARCGSRLRSERVWRRPATDPVRAKRS